MTTQGSGRRRASKHSQPRAKRGPTPRAIAAVLGAVAAGVAWFFLVRAAIDFGNAARDGNSLGWAFTLAASLGAVVCLMLVLVLVTRALVALSLISEYKPRRAAAKRRAG